MNIIKVAANSAISSVAGAIAHSIRDNKQTHIQAIGASAVNQAVKATIMAKRFLAEEGNFITFSPDFVDVMIDGEERTAVRLSVCTSAQLSPLSSEPYSTYEVSSVSEIAPAVPIPGETALDHLAATADAEAVRNQARSFTLDKQLANTFAERQELAYSGRKELLQKLEIHHAESPALSGGDIDAAWDNSMVGEETVGGTTPTPDQDVVEELGEAVGLTCVGDSHSSSAKSSGSMAFAKKLENCGSPSKPGVTCIRRKN